MKKFIIAIILTTSIGISSGQNLVLNPSFENVNVGSLQCSWYTAVAQFNAAINNWTLPTGGSTDIFNTALATTCYCSPFSTNGASPGQQAPRTGNGYVNIVTYGNGGCSPWREYVQGELSTPLVVGTTYEVEMYVSLGDNAAVGSDNIGVKFEVGPYFQASNCPYYTTPELNYTGPIILDKTNWTQISFCYTPTVAGQDHFIIGNFYDDPNTNSAPAGGTQNTIRYFVDDVRIEEVTTSTGNAGTNGTITLCPGAAPVDLFNSLGGTPSTNGTWSGPSALGGGYLGTFDPTTMTAGTYTYTVPGGSGACGGGGSAGMADVVVTIAGTSDATISPAGPFCQNNAAATLAAVDPGGTWSGTGITDAVNGIFDPAVAGPGTHTITYTIVGTCGDTDTEDIVVIANSDATISPAGPFCTTDPAFLMTAVDGGGTWSIITAGAPAGSINAASGSVDPAVLGDGTWTIQYVIAGACGDTDTEDIVISAQLDATITQVGPYCDNDPVVQLTAVDPGGTWSATCGACVTGTGSFDPSIAGSGSHTITYTLSGSCGDVQASTIDVNPYLDATITPAGPFCLGSPSSFLVGASAGGTWSGPGIIDVANGEFDPTTAGPGSHTITYSTPGVCGNSETTTISVSGPLSVTAFSDQTICIGSSATISALASGGDGNIQYAWTDDAGNPIGNGQIETVSPTVTTSYTVTVTDGCGTTPVSATIVITVNPLPVIDFSVDNAAGCAPLTVSFTDNTTPAGTSCTWDFGDTFTGLGCGSISHTYTEPGCYDVTLTVTANGCSNSATQLNMVCVEENAIASFNVTPEVTDVHDPQFQLSNQSSNANAYLWTFGNGDSSVETDPNYLYNAEPGEYQICLVAYTTEGCNDTTCQTVIIEDVLTVFVPNAFTPGDTPGINDVFIPVVRGIDLENYEFMIFDRWGELIFRTTDPSEGWDGSVKGYAVDSKTDVYVWKLKIKDGANAQRKEYIGHVTLLK